MVQQAPKRTKRETTYKGAAKKKTSGLVPKTAMQGKLITALKESQQVFILGPAGTGKTYVTTRKTERVQVDVNIDYLGFEIPDVWVVGYGLDFAEQYRTLPYIGIVKPE